MSSLCDNLMVQENNFRIVSAAFNGAGSVNFKFLCRFLSIRIFQEGVSLIYEGILPSKSPPKFTNLVTMMHPNDNMVNINDSCGIS